MNNTSEQFDQVGNICQEVFENKLKDYGCAWRILRPKSLTDQIFIKAKRIRSIETKGEQKIQENISSEYIGIVNYAIISLIQLELGEADTDDIGLEKAKALYEKYLLQAKELMQNKNHDYGEAWRNMRVSSFTDLILMKLFRTKQIENNQGKTLVSEGIDANYFDMLNYSVFALIKLVIEKNGS